MAEHENYCGSRTEKCSDCGEYVMLKYRTLHLDSNHGFLKLEDGKEIKRFSNKYINLLDNMYYLRLKIKGCLSSQINKMLIYYFMI